MSDLEVARQMHDSIAETFKRLKPSPHVALAVTSAWYVKVLTRVGMSKEEIVGHTKHVCDKRDELEQGNEQ